MKNLFFLLAVLAAVACSKECDQNDPSSWTEACSANRNNGNSSGSNSSGSNNNNNGGTTITYNYQNAPTMPQDIETAAKFQGSPGILATSGKLIFTASWSSATFSQPLASGAYQIYLKDAGSFNVVSPDTSGCPLPKDWGMSAPQTSVIQWVIDDTAACRNVLSQIKVNGATVEFNDVPTNSYNKEKIQHVLFTVRP